VDTSFICQEAPFLALLPGSKLVYIIWFASNFVLYLVYLLFTNI
jgi:hypothetical protein